MSEICTTCLSHDRELQPLGSMQFIYDLLMDNDGYDIPSMKICWECHAYLQHATKFRRRALEAKEFLLKLNFELKSNAGVIRSMPPLSSLSTLEKFNLTDFIENDPLSIVKEEIIEDELNGIDTETMDTEEDNKNAKPTILNYKLPVAKDTAIKNTTPFILQKIVAKTTDKPIKQYKTKKIKAKEIKSESSFFRRGVFKVSKVQYEMELKRLLSEADSRLAVVKHNAVVQSNFREAKDKTDVLSDEEIYEHFTRLANDSLIQVEVLDARQVLKQRNILRTHEQYRDSQFKCKHCILGFTDQEKVDEHMKTKHLLKPSPETIRCDVCMCHIHRGMYQFHVARHHVLYRCAKCGFTVYNGNLDSHVLTHRVNKDGEMAYASIQPKIKLEQTQCTVCNRTISVRNLRKHMEVHKKHNADTKGSKERNFMCDRCGASFKTAAAASLHEIVHTGVKNYLCQICNKRFPRPCSFSRHMSRVHHGMKPPKNKPCPHCDKVFSSTGMLKQHINTHTGARPYCCKTCGATFRNSGALYTHNKLIHLCLKRHVKKKQIEEDTATSDVKAAMDNVVDGTKNVDVSVECQ